MAMAKRPRGKETALPVENICGFQKYHPPDAYSIKIG